MSSVYPGLFWSIYSSASVHDNGGIKGLILTLRGCWESMLTGKGKLRQEGGGDSRQRAICATCNGLCILRLSGDTCSQKNVWRDTTHSSAKWRHQHVSEITAPNWQTRTANKRTHRVCGTIAGVCFDHGLSTTWPTGSCNLTCQTFGDMNWWQVKSQKEIPRKFAGVSNRKVQQSVKQQTQDLSLWKL